MLNASLPPDRRASISKGYSRKDAAATDGIKQILLKGGEAGKAKILLKGQGANLNLTSSTLPLSEVGAVTVQLSNTQNSNCWASAFPPATKNTDGLFKAKNP